MLIDTHCHIHSADYKLSVDQVIKDANQAGVEKLLCVGTDSTDSKLAIQFVKAHDNCWATVGSHPHDAKDFEIEKQQLPKLVGSDKVVAIGECGLDYWYENSPRALQKEMLEFQLDLAVEHKLPLVFHIRGSKADPADAFCDFFNIFDVKKLTHPKLTGVVHSFSARQQELTGVLSRGLFVGLNGIMTFTKDERQLEAAKAIPLEKLVLETDAPFLTPAPKRGNVNEPKHLVLTAEFLSQLRGESIEDISTATTHNAERLFNI